MTSNAIDPRTLQKIIRRGVSEIIVEEEFVRLLQEGKPLRLKMGFDPSRPDIHLGHAVGLRKLRQLQDMGHKVILIVGDWTAQIGDPSGQSATRQMLTAEEVRANAETYMTQFFKVIDKERTQTMWQSEWFGKFSLANVFDLTRRFTVAQFLARDDFAKRFRAQQPIAITELLYPLLQAYDSIAIESDVEFGGTDQMFNILVGRDLQGMMGQNQQQCFFMPLLVGTDGVQKMSKSLGNYIGVDEPANEMYGKVMSIPDSLMMNYFELLTDVPTEELTEMGRAMEAESVNPMELKKRLGRDIVAQFHDQQAALQAEATFESTYQRGDVAEEDITLISAPAGTGAGLELDVFAILVKEGLVGSTSEAKRLLTQGAIKVDGAALESRNARLEFGNVIQVGRRRFARIVAPKS
ncbi:MAG: tyrosine--tRNA ligase [Chloroflexi bacterium]|nr:tyrosine--tRNA ligase [Chloroflexota bacterium]